MGWLVEGRICLQEWVSASEEEARGAGGLKEVEANTREQHDTTACKTTQWERGVVS